MKSIRLHFEGAGVERHQPIKAADRVDGDATRFLHAQSNDSGGRGVRQSDGVRLVTARFGHGNGEKGKTLGRDHAGISFQAGLNREKGAAFEQLITCGPDSDAVFGKSRALGKKRQGLRSCRMGRRHHLLLRQCRDAKGAMHDPACLVNPGGNILPLIVLSIPGHDESVEPCGNRVDGGIPVEKTHPLSGLGKDPHRHRPFQLRKGDREGLIGSGIAWKPTEEHGRDHGGEVAGSPSPTKILLPWPLPDLHAEANT